MSYKQKCKVVSLNLAHPVCDESLEVLHSKVRVSKTKCHRSIVRCGGELILMRLADQHTTQKQADRQTFRTAVAVEG